LPAHQIVLLYGDILLRQHGAGTQQQRSHHCDSSHHRSDSPVLARMR
jgi:hypothetical protein